MPKHIKTCRVCGKQYSSCKSIRTGSPVFNWREVACSHECGEIYLQSIIESRSKPRDVEFTDEFCINDKSERIDNHIITEVCDDD